MLPKETNFYWDKNNQFKHLKRRSIEEIERCNNILGDKLLRLFNKISQKQVKIANTLLVSWGDYLAKYFDPEDFYCNRSP